MMNLEIPTPESGAAYQILFERFQPANCQSHERLEVICKSIEEVIVWSQAQPKDIQEAYRFAVKLMVSQLNARMQQIKLSRAVEAAYISIPRPPDLRPIALTEEKAV